MGARQPEEGLSSHSFHGSEEPGLRLRSRAARLPWKRRVPLSLTAGITVIGGGGWEEDVSLAAPRVGARRQVTPPVPPPVLSPPHTPHPPLRPEASRGCQWGAGLDQEGGLSVRWLWGEVGSQGIPKEAADGPSI